VGTHLDGEIIRNCKERHYHPRLRRELPPGVRSYYVEEIAEALMGVDIVLSGVNSYGGKAQRCFRLRGSVSAVGWTSISRGSSSSLPSSFSRLSSLSRSSTPLA
jgi:hypothetical protein